MTRRDTLTCVHEPFGDAFYFGPERLSERYEKDEKAREESGFDQSTYKSIFERLENEATEVRSCHSYPYMFCASLLIPLLWSVIGILVVIRERFSFLLGYKMQTSGQNSNHRISTLQSTDILCPSLPPVVLVMKIKFCIV